MTHERVEFDKTCANALLRTIDRMAAEDAIFVADSGDIVAWRIER